MAKRDCASEIFEAFKARGKLTEQEIKFIASELRRRFKEAPADAGHDEVWGRTARQLATDIKEAAQIEKRNAELMVQKNQNLEAQEAEAKEKYGDSSLGIEAATVGIDQPLANGRKSVDSEKAAIFDIYTSEITTKLDQAGLTHLYNDGHLDLEVARALEKKTKPEAKGSTDPNANQIADIIHDTRMRAFDRRNRAGAWAKILSGFITRQNHDMIKVFKAGEEEWSKFIKPLLDHKRTFGDSNPDEFLKEAFKPLSTGKHNVTKGADIDLSLAFKGPGNLAKRVSQHRVLHFKDADAWHIYNERFGAGNLREAIFNDLRFMARDTAIMETFGPNPQYLGEKRINALEGIGERRRATLLKQLHEVIGHSSTPVDVDYARVMASVRQVTGMAKLGFSTLSSLSDTATKFMQIRYHDGGGVLSPLAKSVTTFFDGMGKDAKAIALHGRVATDGMIGGVAELMGAHDQTPGIFTNLIRKYFKLNLLTPWTGINKRGMTLFGMNNLAKYSNKSFDRLPDHMKGILRLYGVDEAKWDIARTDTVVKGPDGTSYLFPGRISSREDIPIEMRDAVETAIRTYIVDLTESSIVTPGAKERVQLLRGHMAGTHEGEALRFITQFKQYPLSVWNKVVRRQYYGGANGRGDMMGLAWFIAYATTLGYASVALKSLAKGQEPPDPLSFGTLVQSMTQGGGLGIYGDFLLGQTGSYGRSFGDLILGPTAGTVGDLWEIKSRLQNGDDAASQAVRLAINSTPFVNLFYTRTALDYLILFQLQEMSNPGYLRRREQTLKRDTGQRYWLTAPSKAIPYGGGNKFGEGIR